MLPNHAPTLTVGAAFEMHFISVTRRIYEQPVLDFPGAEQSATASIPGLSLMGGLEFVLSQKFLLGLSAGYRFAQGDVPYFQFPNTDFRLDLSGAFARLWVRVHPWHSSGEQ